MAEQRLIDANALVFDYSGLANIYPDDFRGIAMYFAEQVKAMPTIEERKRGKWYMENHTWFCDRCGKNPTRGMGYVQGRDELFNFCPNCGARMEDQHG